MLPGQLSDRPGLRYRCRGAEPPEAGTEEATEEEDMAAEPNYAFVKGYGRFGIGYTRLATALGNFEQGDIQAEGTVVAHYLTSGLRVAMSRTGWNLLSPRYTLTKIPSTLLSNYYCNGYPSVQKWKIARITNMASASTQKTDGTSSAHGSLETPRLRGSSQATSRHLGTKWATVRKTLIRVIKLAVPSLLQEREAPRLQRGLPVTSGLPHRPRLMGGGSRAVSSRSLRTQLPPPSNLDSFMRWVALATLLLVV